MSTCFPPKYSIYSWLNVRGQEASFVQINQVQSSFIWSSEAIIFIS